MSRYLLPEGIQPSAFLFHLQNERGFAWFLEDNDYTLLTDQTVQACASFADMPEQPLIGAISFSAETPDLDICRYEWDARLRAWTETYPETKPCPSSIPLYQVIATRTEKIYEFKDHMIMVEDIRMPNTGSSYLRILPVLHMQEFKRLCADEKKAPTKSFQYQYQREKDRIMIPLLKDLFKQAHSGESLAGLTELPGTIFRRERQVVMGAQS